MADILSQEEIDTLLNVDDNTTKFFKLKKILNTSIEKALLNLSFDLNCDRFLKAEFNEYKSKFLYDIDELNLLEQKILKIDFKIINGKISSQHTIYVNDILFKNFSISNKLEKEITMKKIILNLIDNIYYHSNNDSYMEQLIEDMCLTMDLKKRFKVLDINISEFIINEKSIKIFNDEMINNSSVYLKINDINITNNNDKMIFIFERELLMYLSHIAEIIPNYISNCISISKNLKYIKEFMKNI